MPHTSRTNRDLILSQRPTWLEYLGSSSSPIAGKLLNAPADAYYGLNHDIVPDFWNAILTKSGRKLLSRGISEHFLKYGRADLASKEAANGWYGIQTTELLADFITNHSPMAIEKNLAISEEVPETSLEVPTPRTAVGTEKELENLMLSLNESLTATHGYNATRHLSIIKQQGAVQAAKTLIAKATIPSGVKRLKSIDELEASVENLTLQHQFSHLFTDQELAKAVRILAAFDFTPRPVN